MSVAKGDRVRVIETGETGLVRWRYRPSEDHPWRVAVRMDADHPFDRRRAWFSEDEIKKED